MAYKKIQVKRGAKTGMPVLRSGEPGFTQDEKSFYVGDGISNQRFLNEIQTNARIDEKITPVTQSIANNVNTLNQTITNNVNTLNQTINTKETTLNEAIIEKIKINDEATNVNFIENKVVQDGLVYSNIPRNFNRYSSGIILDNYDNYTVSCKVSTQQGLTDAIYLFGNSDTVNFKGMHLTINKTTYNLTFVYYDGTKSVSTIVKNINMGLYVNVTLTKKGNIVTIICDDTVKTILLENYSKNTVGQLAINFFTSSATSLRETSIENVTIYNRTLTPQEIQHNLSILNNTPSINRINDYAISTDTDHIQDRTGRTTEDINRVFYKNMCKEFSSNGEAITVNNGMDGYVLSAKLECQTVKNYAREFTDTFWNRQNSKIQFSNGRIVINKDTTDILAWASKTTNLFALEPNKDYYVYVNIYKNTLNGSFDLLNNFTLSNITIPIGTTGFIKRKFTTKSTLTNFNGGAIGSSIGELEMSSYVVTDADYSLTDYVPFGLSSTKAIIYNNNVKYSFYKDSVDKASGTVITLGGVGDVRDTLEVKEDGGAILNKPLIRFTANENATIAILAESVGTNDRVYSIRPSIPTLITSSGTVNGITDVYDTVTNSAIQTNSDNGTTNKVAFISSGLHIRLDKTQYPTIESVKELLRIKPLECVGILATPVVTHIPKELVPTILTQLQNEFKFGEGVAPSKVTIQAPINKIADFETRIAQLEKVITSTSNLSILGNYAEDEYNKEINQL